MLDRLGSNVVMARDEEQRHCIVQIKKNELDSDIENISRKKLFSKAKIGGGCNENINMSHSQIHEQKTNAECRH